MATYFQIKQEGTDLERVDYTSFYAPDPIDLSRETVTPPVVPPAEGDLNWLVIQEGTDLERVDYTEYSPPRPHRLDSSSGDVSSVYSDWAIYDSGLGDISGELENYQFRNGKYFDSGVD